MEILNVMKARRFVRRFKDTAISDTIPDEMLEAARLAPSPGNSQGYLFGVIKDQGILAVSICFPSVMQTRCLAKSN